MNKIILVHYIAFPIAAPIHEMREKMRMYHEKVALMADPDVVNFVLPLRGDDQQPRIECINPKLINETEYTRALDVVNRAEKHLEEWIKQTPPIN